ncbi:hypothetical protein ACFQRL_03610 [Microbacterium fluvii]|uniref:Integral membrane protein n=1 Tax=Microbacterium fluvii TaxID=415215 RepID=A0ABW2H9N0_9MICO|nr:hypothetical protein [Microbacterium fluvii]MCU4671682.1 hypothetical protein [Microbacterium fluvii]
MTELLHAWALAPAAIGTCCLAADRRRVRAPELAASVLMLVAMLDAWSTRLVPAVAWAALLVAGAIVLAMVRSPRRGRRAVDSNTVAMAVHANVGMIAMAALQLGMGVGHTSPGAHQHGVGAQALTALLILGAVVYAVFSAVVAARAHRPLDRVQTVAMAVAVGLMAVAAAI